MPPNNPMTEGEALAVLDVDAIASSLVDWMLTKAMPNGDLLHASVACDYAGMANFKRAVSKQLRAALTAAQQPVQAVEYQSQVSDKDTGEVVYPWARCHKAAYDAVSGQPHEGSKLRVEYRALYTAPPSAPVGVDGCTESNCPRCLTHPDHRGDMAHAGIGGYPTQQPAQAPPDFCDGHCTWLDHAPGCPRHEGASAPVEVDMPAIWHRLGWAESAVPDDWRVLVREARESIETLWNTQQPPSTPVGVERKYPDDGNGDDDAYNRGWNDCLSAVTQQPAQAAPGDDKVLWGVVANAGRLSPTRQQRWAHVVDATGQGSQSSIALCRRFGFDPDETVGVEDDTPPGDDAAGGGHGR